MAQRWYRATGRDWTENDLESLYKSFIPIQVETAVQRSQLLPGLLECVEELRRRDIRIGTTTGYFRAAAERVYEARRSQGFAPDCTICAEDVPSGRPEPWMMFHIMEKVGTYPPCTVVKVDDTVPDNEEGRNAGAWSIGVTQCSSAAGCTPEELATLSAPQRQAKLDAVQKLFFDVGAHAAIESLAELPSLIDRIGVCLRCSRDSLTEQLQMEPKPSK